MARKAFPRLLQSCSLTSPPVSTKASQATGESQGLTRKVSHAGPEKQQRVMLEGTGMDTSPRAAQLGVVGKIC